MAEQGEGEVVVVGEEVVGFPDGASSRLPAEQHLVPGVQDHDDVGGGGVDQADGEHLQLLVDVPLELQGEEMQGVQAELPAQRSPCHPQS